MQFNVAVWWVWSFTQSVSFLPDFDGRVEAPSAFLAIAGVMRLYRLTWVPHAAAIAVDGSLAYRVYRLRLASAVDHEGEGDGVRDVRMHIKQTSLWV